MWSCLVACVLSLAPAQGTRLAGSVSGPDGPLSGATVFVSTARPRRGVGVLCPSCYADCRKRTVTDAAGEFIIEPLDPELLFRLLAYAPGHVPRLSDGYLDPRSGRVELRLEPRNLDSLPPERVLRGRVVDPHGEPVAHAVLEPVGKKLERGELFGSIDVELAISDERGEFAIPCSEPGETLLLLVSARAFAPRMSPWIAAGGELATIALDRGDTVTGVVQKDGRPLGGVELGLDQQDRSARSYLGLQTVGTTAEGRFTFVNVPANDACFLYGLVGSFKSHGALASRSVKTAASETTVDVGALAVEPGHRLQGRVVLADGKPLPAGLRLALGREEAWDAQIAEVGTDGAFEFEGLPVELYNLAGKIPGYVLSPKNESYDPVNRSGLLGRIENDARDLIVLFEPGEETLEMPDPDPVLFERYKRLRTAPLRGAAPDAKRQSGPR